MKNQVLIDAICRTGLSINKFCEAKKLVPGPIYRLVSGRSPVNSMTGRLSVEAARLVEALDVLPEDIWTSEELYPFEVRFEDIGINELRAREVFRRERILPPDEQCERSALTRLVGDVLQTLTYREGLALSMKFGLEGEDTVTQAAVGKALGCSADNVRIIEMRALRKLRHPTRSDCLRTFIPDDWSYA